ncbi:hypothetical protein Tco_0217532, partial [Tanacetum coccineum]
MIISLRREIKPRNPEHATKNCETYGSNVHTTSAHNNIEWFRKREALQAKKADSFKASKTESSSALRLETPTKSLEPSRTLTLGFMNSKMKFKVDLKGQKAMGSTNLGPDLNDKAVNESQYRGMIGSLMNLTASRPNIQFSTGLYARHQANIRNPTLFLLREFS